MAMKGTTKAMAKAVTKVTAAGTPGAPRVIKEVQLSPQLSQLVNAQTLSRPQALKALWAYIKYVFSHSCLFSSHHVILIRANDIKKNETGQYITSDPLKPVIGKATFTPPDVWMFIPSP
jgi:hypothetical protein